MRVIELYHIYVRGTAQVNVYHANKLKEIYWSTYYFVYKEDCKSTELTLYVPKDMVGKVIGKGGSVVKEIGQKKVRK